MHPSIILLLPGARLSKGKAATFLCTAAANGDYALLQMLFECGVETNIGCVCPCLHVPPIPSVRFGLTHSTQLLRHVCIYRDYDARYPIHLAAAEGEVVSVEFLTYAHAEISSKDRWGYVRTWMRISLASIPLAAPRRLNLTLLLPNTQHATAARRWTTPSRRVTCPAPRCCCRSGPRTASLSTT